MAHSRTSAADPCNKGTSDVPCATRPEAGSPNTSASVALMSTFVVSASHHVPPATPGQCTSNGMCPKGSYCMTPGFPQMSFSPK